MTKRDRGFLLHAFTSKELDYATLAVCCALSIKTNLKNNNVAIIMDERIEKSLHSLFSTSVIDKAFDDIIISKQEFKVAKRTHYDTPWENFTADFNNNSRFLSYEHSPYNETILLDTDFIVMNDLFDDIWDNKEDVLINQNVVDLKGDPFPNIHDKRLSKHGIDLYWATVVYFKKSPFAKTFFDLIDYIRENYKFFQFLYEFPPSFYRNDYSFSIAVHMMNGYRSDGIKPLMQDKIIAAYQQDAIAEMKDSGEIIFLSHNTDENWKNTLVNVKDANVHIMNKKELLRISNKFIQSCLEKL